MQASGNVEEGADNYGYLSYLAIGISVLSLLVWATFWPVWGSSFEGDGDDGLRLALSTSSVVLFGVVILPICCRCSSDNTIGLALVVVLFMYAMEKIFEVYILLSDLERLCPGDLGKALVGFQSTEILSVIVILVCMGCGPSVGITDANKPTELDGPI